MHNDKLIIFAIAAVVILLAVLFSKKVKGAFMGFKLDSDNRSRKNIVEIKGNKNSVEQSTSKKTSELSQENRAKIDGDESKVKQD